MTELENIYKHLPKKIKKTILPPDSAGKKITSRVPISTKDQTIADVRKFLFEKTKDLDTINYIYIVSTKGILHGVLSIKQIFSNPPEEKVGNLFKDNPIKAHLKDDQEKVAHLALKNNLKAIPLVDDNDHFLGVVPADQIHNILDNESKEDLLKLTGIIGGFDDASSTPVFTSLKNRAPWIIVGLFGGTVTASAITSFQDVLSNNLALASFIPLIAYIANSVANQSQTLLIRDLATQKEIVFKKYLLKQLTTASLIAVICWVIIYVLASIVWSSGYLGFVVGLSMTCAILTATILGLLVPKILNFTGQDPAVGSGPFATVMQDFLSITIYFSIASSLL